MANAREIRDRMRSIQDTMKITNAMYMISSSKLRRAKKALANTEPYFYTLQSTMSRILRHLPEMHSEYFRDPNAAIDENTIRRAYVVVTADKGMAGAYNHYTIQNPTLSRARNISETLIDAYRTKKVDEIYLIYTSMKNAMTEEAQFMRLLPLERPDFMIKDIPVDLPMEHIAMKPSPEAVMGQIVPDYIVGYIYSARVEAYASEQNARLMAMQAAADNASAILQELGTLYNRARQAAITQEITEVIAGAKAQKKGKN